MPVGAVPLVGSEAEPPCRVLFSHASDPARAPPALPLYDLVPSYARRLKKCFEWYGFTRKTRFGFCAPFRSCTTH